jgi:hypothetical protein
MIRQKHNRTDYFNINSDPSKAAMEQTEDRINEMSILETDRLDNVTPISKGTNFQSTHYNYSQDS